jgi:restriction system protein
VAAELSEALQNASPSFFETVVLDLLHEMGYEQQRAF